jgi:hypothetical protein
MKRLKYSLFGIALVLLAACKDKPQKTELERLSDEMCRCKDAACARSVQAKVRTPEQMTDEVEMLLIRIEVCRDEHFLFGYYDEEEAPPPASPTEQDREEAIQAARAAGIIGDPAKH